MKAQSAQLLSVIANILLPTLCTLLCFTVERKPCMPLGCIEHAVHVPRQHVQKAPLCETASCQKWELHHFEWEPNSVGVECLMSGGPAGCCCPIASVCLQASKDCMILDLVDSCVQDLVDHCLRHLMRNVLVYNASSMCIWCVHVFNVPCIWRVQASNG